MLLRLGLLSLGSGIVLLALLMSGIPTYTFLHSLCTANE